MPTADQVGARLRYLKALKAHLEALDLTAVSPRPSPGKAQAAHVGPVSHALGEVFVDLPVAFWVSVEVSKHRVVRWALTAGGADALDLETGMPREPDLNLSNAQLNALYDLLAPKLGRLVSPAGATEWSEGRHPIVLSPPWEDGVKPFLRQLCATEILSVLDCAVIVGPPGAGKSTVLKYLAVALAAKALDSGRGTVRDAESPLRHLELTPVYVDLGQFVRWPNFPSGRGQVSEQLFWEFVSHTERLRSDQDSLDALHRALKDGKGIVLLDGLDEIPSSRVLGHENLRREQMKDLARALRSAYSGGRIVFSSREYGYRDWALDGFARIPLGTLATGDRQALLARAYEAGGLAPREAQQRCKVFVEALRTVPEELQERPLFVVLLAKVFETNPERGLPGSRGALYRECIDLLVRRWTRGRPADKSLVDLLGCTEEDLLERLASIAYRKQTAAVAVDADVPDIDQDVIIAELFKLEGSADRFRAVDALAFLSDRAGILVSPAGNRYRFLHRGFQEYLAASWLANDARSNGYAKIRLAIEGEPDIWREPCLMMGDILRLGGTDDSIWALLETLLDAPLEEGLRPGDARAWSVWLTGMLVRELLSSGASLGRYRQQLVDELRVWLGWTVGSTGALPSVERSDLAVTLGMLGDTRVGVGVLAGIPSISWCQIPAGPQIVGLTSAMVESTARATWAKGWGFDRDTPARNVFVDSFDISRYPVTVAQYRAFASDRGYERDRWWPLDALEWRNELNPAGPGDQKWGSADNLPITNVSWFEASAFCRWLSETMGSLIRLPTVAEWERAARGPEGWLFPWGEMFEPDRANCRESGIDRVVPVGVFPARDGPWGTETPSDMAGNIWEWCSDSEPQGPVEPPALDPTAGKARMCVLKGGSFLNLPFLLKASYNGRDLPSARYSRQGFRIVRNVSKPSERTVARK